MVRGVMFHAMSRITERSRKGVSFHQMMKNFRQHMQDIEPGVLSNGKYHYRGWTYVVVNSIILTAYQNHDQKEFREEL